MREKVKKGIALLDDIEPGWREHINVDELDLQDGEYCILGQIYGSYTRGLAYISLDVDDSHYGFDIPPGEYQQDTYYSELTRIWKEELA